MPAVHYKEYRESHSTDNIPRSTLYCRRRRRILRNHVLTHTGHRQFVENVVDEQNQEVLSRSDESESEEGLRVHNEDESIPLNELMEVIVNDRDTELNNVSQVNALSETSTRHERLNTDENMNEWNDNIADFEEFYDSHEETFSNEMDSTDDTDDVYDENVNDKNEDNSNNNNYDEFLNSKLCSCTETTKGEALTMALLISQKHCLTRAATVDIIHMTNKLYNCDKLPSSKYGLFKYFPLSKETMKFHLFCPNCQRYLVERDKLLTGNILRCPTCYQDINEANISSFFVIINVKSQIKNLLEYKNIRNQMSCFSRRKVDNDIFADILDGNAYKTSLANRINSRWNLFYIFNTDGCQSSKSSKASIWPIYIMLNELPPKIRSKHMILVGLWVHQKEPNMNTFLRPFVDEANSLIHDGVTWNLNNNVVVSKIYPVCCSVDSVARPHILNMKRFNGFYGCNFCEHPIEGVEGYRRFTISTTVHPDRTDASIRLRMENATHGNIDPDMNMGIKGPSVLMNLEGFDLAKGMVPDYMHSVLLGVTRQYTEIILSSPQQPYYVGSPNNLAVINSRLTSIQPPSCITRSPRSLEERNYWKASERRSWLIWYMMVCLRDILPIKYLKHLALLVGAIHLLIQESVSLEMITLSNEMLVKFVTLFQDYFGKTSMTFNVHLLLHLSESVYNWGPLWAHSTFPFENGNRLLLQMKSSPHLIAVQIAKRYSFYKNVPIHLEKFEKNTRFIEFCDILFSNRLKHVLQVQNCTLIGSGKDYIFTDDEENCYGRRMECTVYQKMICRGFRYTSEVYRRMNRCNDFVIVTQNGKKGIITNICCYNVEGNDETKTEIVIFYREIVESTRAYLVINDICIHHIKECAIDGPLRMCYPEFIRGQCVLMHVNNKYFISEVPKGCLND